LKEEGVFRISGSVVEEKKLLADLAIDDY